MTNLAMRPVGRDVHGQAVRAGAAVIVSRLQEILGRDVVAIITGKQSRQVSRCATGDAAPSARDQQLLRDTYQVVELLAEVEGPEVTRMWFIGMKSADQRNEPFQLSEVTRIVRIDASIEHGCYAGARQLKTDEGSAGEIIVGYEIDIVQLDPIEPPAAFPGFALCPIGSERGS